MDGDDFVLNMLPEIMMLIIYVLYPWYNLVYSFYVYGSLIVIKVLALYLYWYVLVRESMIIDFPQEFHEKYCFSQRLT